MLCPSRGNGWRQQGGRSNVGPLRVRGAAYNGKASVSPMSMPDRDERSEGLVRERIEDWRRRLIDLSWRNPLINFKARPTSSLSITAPSLHTLLADPDREAPFDFYLPPEAEDGDPATAPPRPPTLGELVTTAESRSRIERTLETLARRSNARPREAPHGLGGARRASRGSSRARPGLA
jgi:hypothetical protein